MPQPLRAARRARIALPRTPQPFAASPHPHPCVHNPSVAAAAATSAPAGTCHVSAHEALHVLDARGGGERGEGGVAQ
eukprot:5765105-Pleurochrysis_carterae.AAC.2